MTGTSMLALNRHIYIFILVLEALWYTSIHRN
jgi:hypothetical protein